MRSSIPASLHAVAAGDERLALRPKMVLQGFLRHPFGTRGNNARLHEQATT
jgi:hypothetical protein